MPGPLLTFSQSILAATNMLHSFHCICSRISFLISPSRPANPYHGCLMFIALWACYITTSLFPNANTCYAIMWKQVRTMQLTHTHSHSYSYSHTNSLIFEMKKKTANEAEIHIESITGIKWRRIYAWCNGKKISYHSRHVAIMPTKNKFKHSRALFICVFFSLATSCLKCCKEKKTIEVVECVCIFVWLLYF